MTPAAQAIICGRRRQQVAQSFTADATWTAPLTTSRIETAAGKGGAGQPGTPSSQVKQTELSYGFYRKDGGLDYQTAVVDGWDYGDTYHCTPYQALDNNPTYSGYYVCYRPYYATVGGLPATTGPSTTGFGQTFPGGTGGPAAVTTINNIAITPGATYNIMVPDGGSLAIAYFK